MPESLAPAFFILELIEIRDREKTPLTSRYRWRYKSLTDRIIAAKKKELSGFNRDAVSRASALFDAISPGFHE